MRTGRRLGVDPGGARIGVAVSDPAGLLATPVETVLVGPDALERLVSLVAELAVVEVVVGLPTTLSGLEGPAAARVRAYAVRLAREVRPTPVRLVDERLSTLSAERALRAQGRKRARRRDVVDQVAAVEILQTALDAERMSGRPPGETVEVETG